MNPDNRSFGLLILSILMWSSVISFACLGFGVNIWVGVAFMSSVALTHIVVEIVARRIEPSEAETEPEDEEIDEEPEDEEMEEMEDITEEYYNQVTKAAEELYADYEKVVRLPDLADLVEDLEVTLRTYDSDMLQYIAICSQHFLILLKNKNAVKR